MKRYNISRWSYLLIALLVGKASGQEMATFSSNNMAMYKMLGSPNSNTSFLSTIEMKVRTSQHNLVGSLFHADNGASETFSVKLSGYDKLTLMLFWKAATDGQRNSRQHWYILEIAAPGFSDGEWHNLSMSVEGGGLLHLDGAPLAGRLPNNFTARFPYSSNVVFVFGYFICGCFANATLDGVIPVPLHSQSKLLNQTDSLMPLALQELPKKPGCHQAPCPCEPNGACIYKQWDLVDRCNCTRGYTPDSMCRSEWDTCSHLESGPQCLNGATCRNVLGIDNFQCVCSSGFVGSRCQNTSPCGPQNPCQNGGTCVLFGNVEQQDSMYYGCRCASGFSGKNCTEFVQAPNLGSHGPTNLVLILSLTFGSIILISLAIMGVTCMLKARKRGADRSQNKCTEMHNVSS